MGKGLDMNNLLDIDELNDSQQEYIKSLIKFEIKQDPIDESYNLTFSIKDINTYSFKDNKYIPVNFGYHLQENNLSVKTYKHIMFHIIEWNARKIKDPVIIEQIQNCLSNAQVGDQDNRFLMFSGGVFVMGIELKVRSQDLFRAVELIMGNL